MFSRITVAQENLFFGDKSRSVKANTLLILKMDSIGDYVLFRDFLKVIRTSDKYRNYHITLCGNDWWKDLAETLDRDSVDQFIWLKYNRMFNWRYRLKLFYRIHSQGFETLIHPSYSRDMLTDAVVKHSGAIYKIGYKQFSPGAEHTASDSVYTSLIPATAKFEFEFFRNKHFFEQVLSQDISIQKPIIDYKTNDETKIVICPGAKIAKRQWAPNNFAGLCDRLKRDFPDLEFVICGSETDKILAENVTRNTSLKFTNYTGRLDLPGLLDIFSSAKLIVTNDSGPFHLAVAMQKKVIAVSNGNNYGRFTPYPKNMQTNSAVVFPPEVVLIRSEEERLEKYCREGSPLDINTISVQNVYDAIKLNLHP